MKSQHWHAAQIAAVVLFVVGFVGAMVFGEYSTSTGIVQIPVQQPEFTYCQWTMAISVALFVLGYFGSKGAEQRKKQENRRKAREERERSHHE